MGIIGTFLFLCFVVPFLWGVLKGLVGALFELLLDLVSEFGIFYIIFFIGFLPFRILNWLQTFLHCPWRMFMKTPPSSENAREGLLVLHTIAKIPLYLVLTPLRFVNAVAFNLILRPIYEFWNYLSLRIVKYSLSLSPNYVYYSAGYPNAHNVTAYGLKNGYKAIEWWRGDRKWWEYCLLDWQYKYNESWRIRPIMVLNPRSYFFKRTDGGSRHWFFDKMILGDIGTTIFGS